MCFLYFFFLRLCTLCSARTENECLCVISFRNWREVVYFCFAKCIPFHYNGKVVKFMCIIRLVVYISSSLAMLLMCHIYMNKKLFCSSQMTRCCSLTVFYILFALFFVLYLYL